jgi:hypothetical protein
MEVFINFAFRRQIQQGWVNIGATLGQLKYFTRIGQILRRLTRLYGLKDQENGQQWNFQAVLLLFGGRGEETGDFMSKPELKTEELRIRDTGCRLACPNVSTR